MAGQTETSPLPPEASVGSPSNRIKAYHDAVGYAKRQFDLESMQCLPSSQSTTQPRNSRSALPPSGATSKTAASPATGGGRTAQTTSTPRHSQRLSRPNPAAQKPQPPTNAGLL